MTADDQHTTDDLRAQMDALAAKLAEPDPWDDLVATLNDLHQQIRYSWYADLRPGLRDLTSRVNAARRVVLVTRTRHQPPPDWVDLAALEAEVARYADLVHEWIEKGWRSTSGEWIEYPDTLAADGRSVP